VPSSLRDLRSDGSSESSSSSKRRVDASLRVRFVRSWSDGGLGGLLSGRSVSKEGLGLSEQSCSLLYDDLLDFFESGKIVREGGTSGGSDARVG